MLRGQDVVFGAQRLGVCVSEFRVQALIPKP